MENDKPIKFYLSPLPASDQEAVEWLLELTRISEQGPLHDVPDDVFKKGWYSIGFLYPGLHPDAATDHGPEIATDAEDEVPELVKAEPRLVTPYYLESGWPLLLEPIADEALRRYDAGKLEEDEFYCSEALLAGMCHRSEFCAESVRVERERERQVV